MRLAAFFLLFAPGILLGQNPRFEIVYLADLKYGRDRVWLDNIKTTWHATGINLRLKWADIENDDHGLDWADLDAALQALAQNQLDIYLRVSLIFTRDTWFSQPGYYTADDFHRRWNADFYLNPYALEPNPPRQHSKLLTFISPNARAKMKGFYQQVVDRLNQQPLAVKSKIKLIVPAFSPDDESEYPSRGWIAAKDSTEMSGYAAPEQEAFINFLQAKYQRDHKKLNRIWGSNFTAIATTQIKIADYNWHKQRAPQEPPYQYPKGRKDWIDFKTGELKKFFAEFGAVTHQARFKFGLQFGSFYDNNIVYRGFYDPVSLLEKIDYLIVGDVLEYEPNFDFAADYARSLCKYWDWKKQRAAGSKIKFATETNWPEYNQHPPRMLSAYWTRQLRAFYEGGASALFVSHWGTTDTGEAANVPARVKSGALRTQYSDWLTALGSYKGALLQNIVYNLAAHLSCEQGLYFRCDSGCGGSMDYFYNNGVQVATNPTRYEFPLRRFSKSKGRSQNEKRGDIVTNYMLINSPAYLTSNYNRLQLTTTSYILPEAAHRILRRNDLRNISQTNDANFFARARVE